MGSKSQVSFPVGDALLAIIVSIPFFFILAPLMPLLGTGYTAVAVLAGLFIVNYDDGRLMSEYANVLVASFIGFLVFGGIVFIGLIILGRPRFTIFVRENVVYPIIAYLIGIGATYLSSMKLADESMW